MKLSELKTEVQKYQYFEDTSIIDVALASIVATRLQIGDPVWLVIIGASSGGKSQILRPLALTDTKFIHRVDDLTENTFLSGMKLSKGQGDPSLLARIGRKGIIVMSDLTVLFSKSPESRSTILSQFRMIYDGEMTKFSGTSATPIRWPDKGRGYLGILAGSTPSIYQHFEEVSDMGERFIYYRMKEYDPEKATRLALTRKCNNKDIDEKLATLYADYLKEVILYTGETEVELSESIKDRIIQIAMFAEKVRTVAHRDFKEKTIDRIPVSAMPMRVALQLMSITKALTMIRRYELDDNTVELTDKDLDIIDWICYSLSNEEKRASLKILANIQYGVYAKTQIIADKIGLSTSITGFILQNLASVGVLDRTGDTGSLSWRIRKQSDWNIIRRIEKIDDITEYEDRDITSEEDADKAAEDQLNKWETGKVF